MHEILFRGKRKDNGEWVYGYPVKKIDPLLRTEKWFILVQEYDKSGIDGRPTILRVEMSWYEVLPETVGQYTGLTDKNGKKIFEGDIVTNPKGDIGRVTWYEEHCAFMIYSITENKVYWLFDNDFSLVEIIGNIHDNPELLKGGEG